MDYEEDKRTPEELRAMSLFIASVSVRNVNASTAHILERAEKFQKFIEEGKSRKF